MTKTIHGKVHGKIIELAEELGVPEGQDVEITVRVVSSHKPTRTGEGFLVTEGALADDPYWDAIMEEVHQERKNDSRREPPE
jgi:citrate lyase beta subunit